MLDAFHTLLTIVQIIAIIINDYNFNFHLTSFVYHFILYIQIFFHIHVQTSHTNFYYYSHKKIVAFSYSSGYLRIKS